jgi:hypothetical protein
MISAADTTAFAGRQRRADQAAGVDLNSEARPDRPRSGQLTSSFNDSLIDSALSTDTQSPKPVQARKVRGRWRLRVVILS